MKKNRTKIFLAAFICAVVITLSLSVPASALSAAFSMTAEYDSLEVGDTFEVIIAVNDIRDDVGIVIVESRLFFDFECFEVVDWKHNVPESWGNDLDDLSGVYPRDDNKHFICTYVYGGAKKVGIVDDGVLFTTVTLKVLSEEANGEQLHLKNTIVNNDLFEEFYANEVVMTVYLESEPDISQGQISTEDESSEEPGDESSADSSEQDSEDATEDDSEEAKGTSDNVWKIVFSVAVVVIIVLVGIIIDKRRK